MGILDNLAANKSALLGLSGGLTGYGHPFTNFGYGTRSAIAGQQEDRLRRQQMIEEALMAEAAAKQRRMDEMYAQIGEQLSQTEPFQPASGILKDVDTTQIAQVPGYDTSVEPTREAGPLSFMQDAIKEPQIAQAFLGGEFEGLKGTGIGGAFGAGNIELTPAQRSKQQERIGEIDVMTQSLNDMAAFYNPEDMDLFGRGDIFVAQKKADLGIESAADTERLTRSRAFKNSSEQFFNTYRRLITGAAAAVQELAMLRESILNGSLNAPEFESAYNYMRRTLEHERAVRADLLANGVDPNSQQGQSRIMQSQQQAGLNDPDVIASFLPPEMQEELRKRKAGQQQPRGFIGRVGSSLRDVIYGGGGGPVAEILSVEDE